MSIVNKELDDSFKNWEDLNLLDNEERIEKFVENYRNIVRIGDKIEFNVPSVAKNPVLHYLK